MSNFKKVVIITSIALNIVFIVLLVLLLIELMYYREREYFFGSPHSYSHDFYGEKERRGNPHRFGEDVGEKFGMGFHSEERRLARLFAQQVFAMQELQDNFDRIHQIQQNLIKESYSESYDEKKFRMLFEEFEAIFIINKDIVLEELLVQMRDMESQDRALLISGFLRMSPPHDLR